MLQPMRNTLPLIDSPTAGMACGLRFSWWRLPWCVGLAACLAMWALIPGCVNPGQPDVQNAVANAGTGPDPAAIDLSRTGSLGVENRLRGADYPEVLFYETRAGEAKPTASKVAVAGPNPISPQVAPLRESAPDARGVDLSQVPDAAGTQNCPIPCSASGTPATTADLIASIRIGTSDGRKRAIDIATLRAVAADVGSQPDDMAGLSETTVTEIQRYRRIISAMRSTLLEGGTLNHEVSQRLLDPSADEGAIQIRAVELCTRVRGYGDFDPMPRDQFIAGRAPAFVLYVELDQFAIEAMEAGGHEVSLTQELTLYTQTGTTVWQHRPVNIVDVSRNRRRDFFTTQVVRMPSTLGPQSYRLNLRINDRHGQSMDERKIPIEIVTKSVLAEGTR